MSFFNSLPSISVTDASTKSRAQDAVLVDVRMPEEFHSGHASNAINCPLPALAQCIEKLKQFSRVYVICQSGGRSASAVTKLIQSGIPAVNVLGGTLAWRAHGLPIA